MNQPAIIGALRVLEIILKSSIFVGQLNAKFSTNFSKPLTLDRLPNSIHQCEIVVKVMNGAEPGTERLVDLVQVT